MLKMPLITNSYNPTLFDQGYSTGRRQALNQQHFDQNKGLGALLAGGNRKDAVNEAYRMGRLDDANKLREIDASEKYRADSMAMQKDRFQRSGELHDLNVQLQKHRLNELQNPTIDSMEELQRQKLRLEIENLGKPSFKVPTGYMISEDGRGVVPIPNGPKDLNSDSRIYSDGQIKSASFAKRMQDADKIMNRLEAGDPKNDIPGYDYSFKEWFADHTPIIGGYINRWGVDDSQSYKQAQEDWVRAKLRRESGAAIGKDEMRQEIELYFPQYGDKPETIEQKAKARRAATVNLMRESQGAFNSVYAPEKNPISKKSDYDSGLGVRQKALLDKARDAIKRGAPKDQVMKELQKMLGGYDGR